MTKQFTYTILHDDYKHNGPTEVFAANESSGDLRVSAIYNTPKHTVTKVIATGGS